jgi:hypothetical protein
MYKENIYDNKSNIIENNTKSFEWNITSIAVISGLSFFGAITLFLTFYIAWKCWLRDHIEEIIIDKCFCGYGEYVMMFLDCVGCIQEGWEERKKEKEMEPYLVGLSAKEKIIVRGQVEKNKVRLIAATKLEWDDLCEKAIRPNDKYHKNLLENSIYKKSDGDKKDIEMSPIKENIKLEIKPATPRRRIRRVEV